MLMVLIVGFFVGVVAKFLTPGRTPGGFVITIVLGVAGAAVSHWAGGAFGIYHHDEPVGFIAAVIGAMAILLVYQAFTNQRKLS